MKQTESDREETKNVSGEGFRDFLGTMKEHLETSLQQRAEVALGNGAPGHRAVQAGNEENGTISTAGEKVANGKSDAVAAFREYMSKTPEERYFEAFLNSKGMTQEQFEAQSTADKNALLKEFEDYVKQKVGEATAERLARSAASSLL